MFCHDGYSNTGWFRQILVRLHRQYPLCYPEVVGRPMARASSGTPSAATARIGMWHYSAPPYSVNFAFNNARLNNTKSHSC